MSPSVWVITGFKTETWDRTSTKKVAPDSIIGSYIEASGTLIMHGYTYITAEGDYYGYGRVHASLQRLEEYENLPHADRGKGGVTGGFVYTKDRCSKLPYGQGQEWGAVDMSSAVKVAMFYSPGHTNVYYVMACFATTQVAPVSGFWRNGSRMVGSNVACAKHSWGHNIHSWPEGKADYGISLPKGTTWHSTESKFTIREHASDKYL